MIRGEEDEKQKWVKVDGTLKYYYFIASQYKVTMILYFFYPSSSGGQQGLRPGVVGGKSSRFLA